MAYTTLHPMMDMVLQTFNPVAGTPAGTTIGVAVPIRGQLIEAGMCPNSGVTSTMTLAININDASISSAAATLRTVVTSTLGTFSSVNTYSNAVLTVIPPSPTYVNPGDAISFVTSGGQSSTVGATFYAVVRRN